MKKIYLERIFFTGIIIAVFFCSSLVITPVSNRNANQYSNSSAIPKNSTIQGSSSSTGNEWPMFHNSINHNGTTETISTSNINPFWTNYYGPYCSSPTVANGMVYVGDGKYTHNLFCLDADTGNLLWNYTTGDDILSSPAVANDMVYFGSMDCHLYCLDANNGNQIWNYTTGAGIQSSPAVTNGMVYFGSTDYHLYCLDASNGNQIWNYTTGAGIESSPAVANGLVYFGSDDHNIYCLYANNGTLIWNYTTGAYVYSSPTVVNGMVYVGSEDHNLYCLNANTGSLIWKYITGDIVDSSPAVANGMVYFGSFDDNLYCLNAIAGYLIWNYTTGNHVFSSPAIANGMVYFGSEDNNFYCLNANSGLYIWSDPTGASTNPESNPIYGAFDSSPAISNGSVYIGDSFGQMYCLPMNLLLLPSAPINFHSSDIKGQIVLSWSAPAFKGNPSVTGYKIYRSKIPSEETLLTTVGNVLNYTDVNGSSSGDLYYYTICAYNDAGSSDNSSEISGTGGIAFTIGGMGVGLILSVSSIGIIVTVITVKKRIR